MRRSQTGKNILTSWAITFLVMNASGVSAKSHISIPLDQLPEPGEASIFKAKTTALFTRPATKPATPSSPNSSPGNGSAGDPAEKATSQQNRMPAPSDSASGSSAESNSAKKLEFGSIRKADKPAGGEIDNWRRYYDAGLLDLEGRRYENAEDRLNASLKAARLGMGNDEKLMLSRIALAQVYMGMQKYTEAEKLFTSCLSNAKHLKGAASAEAASCEEGLAAIDLTNGKLPKAEALINDALAIRTKTSGNSRSTAKCLILKAQVLSKTNWTEQAEATALDGIKMLHESLGTSQIELADALRHAALMFHDHGKGAEAQELFERSYKLIDDNARLNMPPEVEGQINFRWEEGSPRSQEIPDADFPLKYLQVDNVRVAATVIDLWELYGVLISITNTGSERINIGLGKARLFGCSTDVTRPHLDKLEIIDPGSIDRIRRERVMWDLTMNRPWLANMQKTRSQRGFVPSQGHDLFRGPNVFGVYGEWNALPRDLPVKIMLEPSPERVQYQALTKIDPGLVRSSTVKLRNLVPVSLEPFESRTGELFFLNPRCERLILTVPVGNVIYQIPFNAKRKRIK